MSMKKLFEDHFDDLCSVILKYIICFGAVLFILSIGTSLESSSQNLAPVCAGMSQPFYPNGFECCMGCSDLDMDFLHYDLDTGFIKGTNVDCWCTDGQHSEQIW